MQGLLVESRSGREVEAESWAIFNAEGAPEVADAEFLEVVGPLRASPSTEAPDRFWAAHGFLLDVAHPSHYEKAGRWYHASLKKVQDRVVARLEDVTERFVAQLHRRKFLSVAAHDVRGPLANVRSYASLLLSPRMSLDPRTHKALEVMGRNTDRALHLVHALFELWKDELGPLALEKERRPLGPLLEAAESRARELATSLGVHILGPRPEPLPEVEVDPERLAAALDVFWKNALGRSQAGDTVRWEVERAPHQIRVSFWDRGPTLSGEEMAHAFERDFVVSHARKLDGRFELCLGAAFVRAHGGNVAVSQGLDGTAFCFSLPTGLPSPA